MNAASVAAVTLASHADSAIRRGRPLRLPAHPAFLTVRRARLEVNGGGDVGDWFELVRPGGAPLVLARAGVAVEPVVSGPQGDWRVRGDDGALRLEPVTAPPAPPVGLEEGTRALRSASAAALDTAADAAPAAWLEVVRRARAILDSPGSGEEVSDVAWPHFLLAPGASAAAQRLAAAAATLWWWDEPGAWTGPVAAVCAELLGDAVAAALVAAVAAPPG